MLQQITKEVALCGTVYIYIIIIKYIHLSTYICIYIIHTTYLTVTSGFG